MCANEGKISWEAVLNRTCTGHPRCWGVGTLLVRVDVLGNEASENRNGKHE